MTKLLTLLLIAVGPWITGMSDCGFTVLWTSGEESTGWVQLEDGERIYETYAGRRTHSRFHRVRIEGRQAGTVVKYSIGGQSLKDNSNPRRPVYGEEVIEGPFSVKTFDRGAKGCHFSVMNDVHMKTRRYSAYVVQIDSASTDFIFLNGDIISAGHHPLDSIIRYEIQPLGSLAAGIPVMFARGNHEGRGDGIRNVARIYDRDGELPFTYMFRDGPAAFVVFDAGETGIRNSIAMSGGEIYEDYLRRQMEWASKAFRSREWRNATVRICLVHVPMVDYGVPDDFVVHTWMNRNIVPMLNKAGVNLMIGADLHEYQYHGPGSVGNDFPIIVNSDEARLQVDVDGREIRITVIGEDGGVQHIHRLSNNGRRR